MKELSADEALHLLNKFTETDNAETLDSGACVYVAGSKTYCAQLSRDQCNQLRGAFTSGGKCP
jgi:hypothetical protein